MLKEVVPEGLIDLSCCGATIDEPACFRIPPSPPEKKCAESSIRGLLSQTLLKTQQQSDPNKLMTFEIFDQSDEET